MDLRSTLNLPEANDAIPMKANLPSLEPTIQARWNEIDIYARIQQVRKDAPTFVLHDGPPYTNSAIHLGTAMNKILKDFVTKSRTIMGFRCPYVPGFDNHGLPIEQSVIKKLQDKKVDFDITTLREACREHAADFIKIQSDQFRRLGVFGLWDTPYTTMNYRFEAEIVRVFKRLVEGGYVYRGLRPTMWSPTSRTALADTEIVYQDHVSKAIYVRFALRKDPNRLFERFPNLYTVIWTTTPWTIPANLAVAFHPEFRYAVVAVGQDHYLVAESLVDRLSEQLAWTNPRVEEVLDGINLEHAEFSHPIFDRPSVAVMAEYVTGEDGTGVVHTAPSHGRDDFFTGQKYKLAVPNTVDERGYLTQEAGEFAGTFYKDCDVKVLERLAEVGALLTSYDYEHSYPYAERDGKPVIFRATEQWFVALDHNGLRQKMLAATDAVQWVPSAGINRIQAMVANRPDWCVSRQRPWGVGIPVFYGASSRKPVLDPVAIEAVAKLVEERGSDAWFTVDPHEILPADFSHPETGETEFIKETDVLDVWFDSGSTSLCVLEGNVQPEWKEAWPADLYLEGSDQHRGWFNSSLILGMAVREAAPYKAVVTHGFVTDEHGRKMSKRLGNIVDPVEACEKYGADVLRYWVASVDYANDVPCSDALLKQFGENYRNVRNTIRFLQMNLGGYRAQEASLAAIHPLDEWVMEQVDLLVTDCLDAYAQYDFGRVVNAVHNFCREQLSKFYLDSIKDRMYCEAAGSPERISGQAACYYVLVRLLKLVSPILVFTAEEAWTKLSEVVGLDREQSIHEQVLEAPSADRLAEIEGSPLQTRYATVLSVREAVFASFEQWKAANDVKDSQDVKVFLTDEGETLRQLLTFTQEELSILLKCSWVEVSEGAPDVRFEKSEYLKCERSRLRRPDVALVSGSLNGSGTLENVPLTARDRRVLGL
jgi:isoleucyl-tRNA synthetase